MIDNDNRDSPGATLPEWLQQSLDDTQILGKRIYAMSPDQYKKLYQRMNDEKEDLRRRVNDPYNWKDSEAVLGGVVKKRMFPELPTAEAEAAASDVAHKDMRHDDDGLDALHAWNVDAKTFGP